MKDQKYHNQIDTAMITTDIIKEIYSYIIYDPTNSYFRNNMNANSPIDSVPPDIVNANTNSYSYFKNCKIIAACRKVVENMDENMTEDEFQELLIQQLDVIESIQNILNELKLGNFYKSKFVIDMFNENKDECSICSHQCIRIFNRNNNTFSHHQECLFDYFIKQLKSIYHIKEKNNKRCNVYSKRDVNKINFFINCPHCKDIISSTFIINILYRKFRFLAFSDSMSPNTGIIG